jgi:hypothetical protein
LTTSLLVTVADDDLAEVERQLRARVEAGWEQGVPATLRLRELAADPLEQPWLVRAVVASTPSRLIGSVGFNAPPDDDGRVKIGYDIVASERRQGSAARGLARCSTGRGPQVALAPASPPSLPTTNPPSPSSARSGFSTGASTSTRSTDWSSSSSGDCHSRPDRRSESRDSTFPHRQVTVRFRFRL